MKNPFIFGDIVKGEHFADREEEVRTLTLDLSSGQNVLLFSPRRYGKTSLIIRVLDKLKAEGFVPVYVDLFRVTSLQSLGKVYAAAITQATTSKIEEAAQFIRTHFPTIVPKVVIKTGGETDFELDFETPRRDLTRWLDEIYDMPQQIAQRKGKSFVVVFDEFQEVSNVGGQGTVERSLRAKIQHHDKVAYVFMGSKRHLLDELFEDKTKPMYRIAKSMPLGTIPKEQLSAFILERFRSTQIRITQQEVDRIMEITGGHPYYTQQLCHEIYNVTVPQDQVKDTDITNACEYSIQAQSYAYTTIWDGLAGKQRELVVALTKAPASTIYSQEFLDRFSLGSASSIQTAIEALEKKGIVDRENGSYILSDVFFTEWVRRKIA